MCFFFFLFCFWQVAHSPPIASSNLSVSQSFGPVLEISFNETKTAATVHLANRKIAETVMGQGQYLNNTKLALQWVANPPSAVSSSATMAVAVVRGEDLRAFDLGGARLFVADCTFLLFVISLFNPGGRSRYRSTKRARFDWH